MLRNYVGVGESDWRMKDLKFEFEFQLLTSTVVIIILLKQRRHMKPWKYMATVWADMPVQLLKSHLIPQKLNFIQLTWNSAILQQW